MHKALLINLDGNEIFIKEFPVQIKKHRTE